MNMDFLDNYSYFVLSNRKLWLSVLKSDRKLWNFRGRNYRTFTENFIAKSQDTRKPRIISRSDG